ncbi:BFO_2992 family lipoprotein [Parabacteroides sp.]
MKKLKSLVAVAMTAVVLTSCLDGGNSESQYEAYAVVKMSTKSFRNLAYESDYSVPIYSPQLDNLTDGQCIYAWKKINGDDPVNQSATEFYTASEFQYRKISKGEVATSLDDTTTIKKNEMTVLDAGAVSYIKGMLFVLSSHPNAASDQTNQISLSYDRSQEVKEISGQRVYEIFLRAVKVTDGKNNTGTVTFDNAFEMSSFFNYAISQEKAENKQNVYFRFNYIKEFNKDTTAATWATSKVIDYPIPTDK